MYKHIVIDTNIKNVIIKVAIISVLSLLFFGVKHSAFAMVPDAIRQLTTPKLPKQALSIDPAVSDIQLIPGQTTSYQLTVTNLSTKPLGIGTALSDIDGLNTNPQQMQQTAPMIGWTHLSDTNIIIGPQEKKQITVTITPPLSSHNGGYYEAIFLTPIVSNQQGPNEPIILSRIGTLVFATVGTLNYEDLQKKVHVVDFKPTQAVFENNTVSLSFSVTNNYFTHFTAKPFLTITPLLFGAGKTTLLEEKHILPGKTRTWGIPATAQFGHIIYKAHLAVFVGDGKQLDADTLIIVLPYKPLLIIIFVLLILLIYIKKRANINRALEILINGK